MFEYICGTIVIILVVMVVATTIWLYSCPNKNLYVGFEDDEDEEDS